MPSLLPDKYAGTKVWVSLFLFTLSLLVTFLFYNHAKELENSRIEQAFDQQAYTKAQRVFLRIEGYERALLDLRGLFIANRHVTESQFTNYLDGIKIRNRYPALYRVGYAPLITAENKSFIEREIRKKGKPDFHLDTKVENHAVALYGYPSIDGALGAVLEADPVRREAMLQARDTAKPRITPALELRFDQENKYGFLIYVPLYRNGVPPAMLEERRANLEGFIWASFRAEDLIVYTIFEDMKKYMDLELYDSYRTDPANLFFSSKDLLPSPDASDPSLVTSSQQLPVLGKWWTFFFKAKPAFIAENRSYLPWVVAIGGFFVSLLVAWLSSVIIDYIQSERRVRQLAFYDGLTGLPNRANFCETLNKNIARNPPVRMPVAVLILELTGFKQINYTLGHPIGDELLKKVGARLKEQFKDHGFIARLGNVQFGAMLSNCSQNDVLGKVDRTIQGFIKPFTVEDVSYELGIHIGIAFCPGHGSNPSSLLQHADIALNQARTGGRGYAIYDELQDPYKLQHLAIVGDFRTAITDNQLLLYCQPKADLRTGVITSVEALLRWHHPSYGFIPPVQFIPLIEPTALIHPLTMYVLEQAAKQAYEWSRHNIRIPIAVNLSTRNLLDGRLPERLDRTLKDWGGQPDWIDLEITESSIMTEPVESLRVLNRIHGMGYRIAVDDFGTGYSGLSYLMKLPVDVIKIDHSFTMHMTEDEDAAAIVKSIIDMAHAMGKKVVAEGTVDEATWKALADMHCDEAQGEYISLALPVTDFESWLKNSRWHSPESAMAG